MPYLFSHLGENPTRDLRLRFSEGKLGMVRSIGPVLAVEKFAGCTDVAVYWCDIADANWN
jgi:hypothetical protein